MENDERERCSECGEYNVHCTCNDDADDENYNRCENCGCFFDDCDCDETTDPEDEPEDEDEPEQLALEPTPKDIARSAKLWTRTEITDEEIRLNDEARAKLESDPRIIENALPAFMALLREFDAHMRANQIPEAVAVHDRVDLFAAQLQGGSTFGMCCEDGAGGFLERAAAAPAGEVPMWGQAGSFIIEPIPAVKVRVEYDGIFGIGSGFTFSTHAVNWNKQFISNTGYRSFAGYVPTSIHEGWGVDDWTAEVIRRYVAAEYKKKPLPFVVLAHRPDEDETLPDPAAAPAFIASREGQFGLFGCDGQLGPWHPTKAAAVTAAAQLSLF